MKFFHFFKVLIFKEMNENQKMNICLKEKRITFFLKINCNTLG